MERCVADAPLRTHRGTVPTLGFTGELQEGSNVSLRTRWYDTANGTFTAKDPFAGDDTQPSSLMPYQYAYDAPTMWTDPSGRCGDPFTAALCLAGGSIAGVAGGAAGTVVAGVAVMIAVPATVALYPGHEYAETNRANLARGVDYVLHGGYGDVWNDSPPPVHTGSIEPPPPNAAPPGFTGQTPDPFPTEQPCPILVFPWETPFGPSTSGEWETPAPGPLVLAAISRQSNGSSGPDFDPANAHQPVT